MTARFEAAWLASRQPFDERALDGRAIEIARRWAAQRPDGRPIRVADLGSGTGVALRRATQWLRGRPAMLFAIDADSGVLGAAPTAWNDHGWAVHPRPGDGLAMYAVDRGGQRATVVPIVGNVLEPLDGPGGPADRTVDLVLAHALADLVPLDRLAGRVAALLRPGGLAHLALTYDGETVFHPSDDAALDARVMAAYHQHMDLPRVNCSTYGGSTAGKRLARALEEAGLRLLRVAPSIWRVRAESGDGVAARDVMARMLRFVVESQADLGAIPAGELARWERSKRHLIESGLLSLRVRHVDVLATPPG